MGNSHNRKHIQDGKAPISKETQENLDRTIDNILFNESSEKNKLEKIGFCFCC